MVYHDVMLDKNVVGSVEVAQEGLYSRFRCVCTLPASGLYKLVVCGNDQRTELGICVPQGPHFGLDTKIARKKIGEGTLRFHIIPVHARSEGGFVPVNPEKPFVYLQMLDSAHTEIRGDKLGVVIPKLNSQAGST